MSVWLFWSSDAQTQGAVLNTWADVLMLLATLLRRNQAAVGPSVGVALGKHWQCFSGDTHTHTYTPKCVTKGGDREMAHIKKSTKKKWWNT